MPPPVKIVVLMAAGIAPTPTTTGWSEPLAELARRTCNRKARNLANLFTHKNVETHAFRVCELLHQLDLLSPELVQVWIPAINQFSPAC